MLQSWVFDFLTKVSCFAFSDCDGLFAAFSRFPFIHLPDIIDQVDYHINFYSSACKSYEAVRVIYGPGERPENRGKAS